MHAVKLKSGPIFALFKVKKWSNYFVFFCFRKSRSPCRKKRVFEKQAQQQQKNTIFNFRICYFIVVLVLGGRLKPHIFIVFSAKMQNLKNTKKKKNTICEHNCANSSCQNVRFFCIFYFCCFSNFHFSEMFLTGFQKSKQNKIAKQEEPKNNNNQKTSCKAKRN